VFTARYGLIPYIKQIMFLLQKVKRSGFRCTVSIQAISFPWKHVREQVTHLHIVSRLKMSGVISQLHPYTPSWDQRRNNFTFDMYVKEYKLVLISVCIIMFDFYVLKKHSQLYSVFKSICIEVRLPIPVYHFRVTHHILGTFEKLAKSDYWLRRVCPSVQLSVRMDQLDSHWTDFRKICYFNIFLKSV